MKRRESVCDGWERPALWGWAVLVVLAVPAAGQSRSVLREVRKLHERLARPEAPLSEKDARDARERLAVWDLDPRRLGPQDRRSLRELQIVAALGTGDVAAAREPLAALTKLAPDEPGTWQWTYLVAVAAGDAQRAHEAIVRLRKRAERAESRAWLRRLRWIRRVGQDAPDVTIRTEDQSEYPVARRGQQVLVIDFWNTWRPPPEQTVAALKRLYEQYRHEPHVAFVGVNADSESDLAKARAFAKDHGLVWPQCYEGRSAAAPISHKAFKVGRPPWTVLVDSYGYIRAVGSGDEPGFVYALRAAVAEASGAVAPVGPRTVDGQQRGAGLARQEAKPAVEATSPGDLPSNPQAASKLRQARAYLKTGLRKKAKQLLEEIIRDYPGTLEAYKAKEYLETIP